MDEITLKALAKINLGLDVVRRREDGYHEVRMIMQTIHLYDLLEIQKIREPEIQIVSNLSFLPVNENNLVYKAAWPPLPGFHGVTVAVIFTWYSSKGSGSLGSSGVSGSSGSSGSTGISSEISIS